MALEDNIQILKKAVEKAEAQIEKRNDFEKRFLLLGEAVKRIRDEIKESNKKERDSINKDAEKMLTYLAENKIKKTAEEVLNYVANNKLESFAKDKVNNAVEKLNKTLESFEKLVEETQKISASDRRSAMKYIDMKLEDLEIPGAYDDKEVWDTLSNLQNGLEEANKLIEKLPELETAEEIRNKLEELEGDERLDKSAIKGLKEDFERLEKQIVSSSGGGALGGRDIIKTYDLSSQLDGATKTFNIPANYLILDVRSSSFPYAFRYGVDWTNTNTTITFTSEITASGTLATGQTLYIIYVAA